VLLVGLTPVVASAEDPFLRRSATVRVVEDVGPAVVNITTRIQVRRRPFQPFAGDPFFDRFFQDLFEPRLPRTAQSLGSGVVIDAQGHVLTNEHVVARADTILATLADGREFEATLVGADPNNDLAVLQLSGATDVPWVPPGSSDDLMVGEPVIAIGNPFGLSSSVTTGVLSAVNRSLRTNDRVFHGFLQTDASINPGNSGGPLLNANGELVGINTAIYQGAQGIGFAIPIDVATRVVHELNSPGARGGVRRGDVITRCDESRIQAARDFYDLLERSTSGQELTLRVWREGREQQLRAEVHEIADSEIAGLAEQMLGMVLEAHPQGGFQVASVRAASGAARTGIEPGDLILGINGSALDGTEAFQRAVLGLRGRDRALVVVGRGRGRYHVTVPLS
jgi:S1-C subfamily serine protease